MLRSTIPRLFLSLPPWRIPNNPPRDLPPRRLLFLFRSFVSFLPLTFPRIQQFSWIISAGCTSSIQCWVVIQQLALIGKGSPAYSYASTPLEPPIESLTWLMLGSDPATRSHLVDVHCILCPVAPLEHPMGPSNFGIFGFWHIPAPQTFGFV